ncbi:hypothetical protein EYF80_042827 [Liparis tanakae]|uniref:Uncharacterized protein n=1 Tax=Liparis tanakae TaxID=230148 RepID=A0A4Z2G069_9TELE|nr:hypothetical protein EYF80_042827 [Liparis tanakae]
MIDNAVQTVHTGDEELTWRGPRPRTGQMQRRISPPGSRASTSFCQPVSFMPFDATSCLDGFLSYPTPLKSHIAARSMTGGRPTRQEASDTARSNGPYETDGPYETNGPYKTDGPHETDGPYMTNGPYETNAEFLQCDSVYSMLLVIEVFQVFQVSTPGLVSTDGARRSRETRRIGERMEQNKKKKKTKTKKRELKAGKDELIRELCAAERKKKDIFPICWGRRLSLSSSLISGILFLPLSAAAVSERAPEQQAEVAASVPLTDASVRPAATSANSAC